jgi:hypothetical protein
MALQIERWISYPFFNSTNTCAISSQQNGELSIRVLVISVSSIGLSLLGRKNSRTPSGRSSLQLRRLHCALRSAGQILRYKFQLDKLGLYV